MSSNRCVIEGEVVELESLRYTPAGLARVAFKLRHTSMQQEAGMQRQVQCVVSALALGEAAQQVSRLQSEGESRRFPGAAQPEDRATGFAH